VVDMPSASRHRVDVRHPSSKADQSAGHNTIGFKVWDSIRQEERDPRGKKTFFFKRLMRERRSAEPLQ
jgi:hypothetical protein